MKFCHYGKAMIAQLYPNVYRLKLYSNYNVRYKRLPNNKPPVLFDRL